MRKEGLLKVFLYLWLFGSIISFILQFFFSEIVANLSLWNHSNGWQREIALWNIGISFAILYALFSKKSENLRLMTLLVFVVSIILGTNHLIAMILNKNLFLINIFGTLFNYVAVLFRVYILYIDTKGQSLIKSP